MLSEIRSPTLTASNDANDGHRHDAFLPTTWPPGGRDVVSMPEQTNQTNTAINAPPLYVNDVNQMGPYQDQRVVHSDREILTEYNDEAEYPGSGLQESGRKYVHPLWNPVLFLHNMDGLGRIILVYIIVAALITFALLLEMRYGVPQIRPHAGAVTDVAKCSEIGMSIMKRGGSAVDAAIASMVCVEVINFQSTGIGGGGFMLVYDHRKHEGKVLDFRETAPSRFTPEMMQQADSVPPAPPKSDVLMVGVPGLLKGFDAAHRLYGKLPWHELFDPAVNLARHGFNVTETLAFASRTQLQHRFLNDELRNLLHIKYSNKGDDKLVHAGYNLRRENLAYTLERVANMGAHDFYEGNLAHKLVEDITSMGGIITLDDLRNYHVIVREPLLANISEYTVMTSPPPSSGPALIFGLKLMEKFTSSAEHVAAGHHLALDNADAWHHLIETLKYIFIQQSRLGDVSGTVSTSDAVNRTQADILSTDAVERAFKAFNNSHALSPSAYYEAVGIKEEIFQAEDAGTSGGVFVDNNELYVSVITSLNAQFGAGLVSEHLGILLNNQLRDFASVESEHNNNLARPNKRPLSSMTPTVFFHPIKSCHKRGAVAGSNGTRLLSGMFEVLSRMLLFDEDVYSAIEAPRVHVGKYPERQVFAENGVPQNIIDELLRRGQNMVTLPDRKQSAVNALIKWNDTLIGHGDSRKQGAEAVYK